MNWKNAVSARHGPVLPCIHSRNWFHSVWSMRRRARLWKSTSMPGGRGILVVVNRWCWRSRIAMCRRILHTPGTKYGAIISLSSSGSVGLRFMTSSDLEKFAERHTRGQRAILKWSNLRSILQKYRESWSDLRPFETLVAVQYCVPLMTPWSCKMLKTNDW